MLSAVARSCSVGVWPFIAVCSVNAYVVLVLPVLVDKVSKRLGSSQLGSASPLCQ